MNTTKIFSTYHATLSDKKVEGSPQSLIKKRLLQPEAHDKVINFTFQWKKYRSTYLSVKLTPSNSNTRLAQIHQSRGNVPKISTKNSTFLSLQVQLYLYKEQFNTSGNEVG